VTLLRGGGEKAQQAESLLGPNGVPTLQQASRPSRYEAPLFEERVSKVRLLERMAFYLLM